MGDFTFKPVTAANWDDLVALFEARGGPKNCWCMAWRVKPRGARQGSAAERKAVLKAALRSRVTDHVPIGILAYGDGMPVGWCSIAPRDSYRPLGGPAHREGVWAVACFFVLRAWRGRGLFDALLAAIAHARDNGAKVVEVYGAERDSPSYRFMGLREVYEAAGFVAVGTAGTRRTVMRLTVG